MVPPEYSQYYSEKLVVLPHSYHYNGHDSLYRHLYDGVLSPRIILRLRYAIARDWRWLSGTNMNCTVQSPVLRNILFDARRRASDGLREPTSSKGSSCWMLAKVCLHLCSH